MTYNICFGLHVEGKLPFSWVPGARIFHDFQASAAIANVVFRQFSAQLRKANIMLRVCEPLRILLLLAALRM